MAEPDWTAVLSADSALWAAIFSGATFVTAGIALLWARKAAIHAGTQAEAATGQIALLKRQIEQGDPRPIVILDLRHHFHDDNDRDFLFALRNVGRDHAFDVRLSRLFAEGKNGVDCDREFVVEPIIMAGTSEVPRIARSKNENRGWLADLDDELMLKQCLDAMAAEELTRVTEEAIPVIGRLTITYLSIAGEKFEHDFLLTVERRTVRSRPARSLADEAADIV